MKRIKDIFLLSAIAIPIGVIVGAITSYFGQILLIIGDFRDDNKKYLIPFLAIGGIISVLLYEKFGGKSKEGMSLLIKTGHSKNDGIPIRLVPLIICGTWLTHLFGGSAGREGVAVQIGGTVAYNIGKKTKVENADKILLITGMACGFAGLFQTPLAGILFAIEVMAIGKVRYMAIPPSVIGALISYKTSSLLGLEKFAVKIDTVPKFEAVTIVKILIIAIIFGIVGGGFAFVLGKAKALAKKIANPYIRIGIISIVLSIIILLLHNGRYAGLGTNLISQSLNGDQILPYDFALKFVLTIITLSAGYQGGEVTPLFSIGATLGSVLGGLMGLPTIFMAGLGYCAVFGAATNTLIAPMLICLEVFGVKALPYAILVCTISYFTNINQTIYKTKLED